MPGSEDREVFRAGVGLLVVDFDGRVLAFERADVPGAWQLPQGGLKAGEDLEHAAWRELQEETGLTPQEVVLDTVSDAWTCYELPADMRSPKTGRGQVHRWFLFRLRAQSELAAMPSGGSVEFRARKWMAMSEVIQAAVSFRQPVYGMLADWFSEHLSP